MAVESVFRRSDGYITTWVNWLNNIEPNGSRVEQCVIRDTSGWWRDAACEEQHEYYCEGIPKDEKGSTRLSCL